MGQRGGIRKCQHIAVSVYSHIAAHHVGCWPYVEGRSTPCWTFTLASKPDIQSNQRMASAAARRSARKKNGVGADEGQVAGSGEAASGTAAPKKRRAKPVSTVPKFGVHSGLHVILIMVSHGRTRSHNIHTWQTWRFKEQGKANVCHWDGRVGNVGTDTLMSCILTLLPIVLPIEEPASVCVLQDVIAAHIACQNPACLIATSVQTFALTWRPHDLRLAVLLCCASAAANTLHHVTCDA